MIIDDPKPDEMVLVLRIRNPEDKLYSRAVAHALIEYGQQVSREAANHPDGPITATAGSGRIPTASGMVVEWQAHYADGPA